MEFLSEIWDKLWCDRAVMLLALPKDLNLNNAAELQHILYILGYWISVAFYCRKKKRFLIYLETCSVKINTSMLFTNSTNIVMVEQRYEKILMMNLAKLYKLKGILYHRKRVAYILSFLFVVWEKSYCFECLISYLFSGQRTDSNLSAVVHINFL